MERTVLGTSVLRKHAIAAFFAYFSKVRISHIFSAQIGIVDGNFNYLNIRCVSICINNQFMRTVLNV